MGSACGPLCRCRCNGAGVTLETGGVAALFRQGKAISCSKSSSRNVGVTVRFLLPEL